MQEPLSRRRFVSLGLNSPWVLRNTGKMALFGLMGGAVWPLSSAFGQSVHGYHHLRAQDIRILQRLLPVAVGWQRSAQKGEGPDLELVIRGLDEMFLVLSEQHRNDLFFLFDLLTFPVSRKILGLWKDWDAATDQELETMLHAWSESSLELKRYAYQSLVLLLQFAWYSTEKGAQLTGYPGPPAAIRPFLRAEGEL